MATDTCNTDISGCSETDPPNQDASKFEFKMLKCRTPILTDISGSVCTSLDTQTATGTDLIVDSTCTNKIYYGSHEASITSTSSTTLSFKLDKIDVPTHKCYPVSVFIANRGKAIIQTGQAKRTFHLKPYINNISPTSGSVKGGTQLTIEGGGFMNSSKVWIGDKVCMIKTLIYQKIVCTTPAQAHNTTGKEVKVLVRTAYHFKSKNEGTAVVPHAIYAPFSCSQMCKSYYCSNSFVNGISPAGIQDLVSGRNVIMRGGNFTVGTMVQFGGLTMDILHVTNDSITCSPPASTSINTKVDQDIIVLVPNQVACQVTSSGGCTFQFTEADTPTCTAVSPTQLTSSAHTITFTCSNLGTDPSKLSITIGDIDCPVISGTFSATSMQCDGSDLMHGPQKIVGHVSGKGNICMDASGLICVSTTTTLVVTVKASLESVSPTTGSTEGGTCLTIQGYGWYTDPDLTQVTVDGNPCVPGSLNISSSKEILCKTPRKGSTGQVDVEVKTKPTVSSSYYSAPVVQFDYTLTDMPAISALSPDHGTTGTVITLTGTHLYPSSGTVAPVVTIDSAFTCLVDMSSLVTSADSLTFTLPSHPAGSYDLDVSLCSKGNASHPSSGPLKIKYDLTITDVSPTDGKSP